MELRAVKTIQRNLKKLDKLRKEQGNVSCVGLVLVSRAGHVSLGGSNLFLQAADSCSLAQTIYKSPNWHNAQVFQIELRPMPSKPSLYHRFWKPL